MTARSTTIRATTSRSTTSSTGRSTGSGNNAFVQNQVTTLNDKDTSRQRDLQPVQSTANGNAEGGEANAKEGIDASGANGGEAAAMPRPMAVTAATAARQAATYGGKSYGGDADGGKSMAATPTVARPRR